MFEVKEGSTRVRNGKPTYKRKYANLITGNRVKVALDTNTQDTNPQKPIHNVFEAICECLEIILRQELNEFQDFFINQVDDQLEIFVTKRNLTTQYSDDGVLLIIGGLKIVYCQ